MSPAMQQALLDSLHVLHHAVDVVRLWNAVDFMFIVALVSFGGWHHSAVLRRP